MISYLDHLKRSDNHLDTRWIVKYSKNGLVREVKQVYKPSEYYKLNRHKGTSPKPLHNKNVLIKILEDDRKKRNS